MIIHGHQQITIRRMGIVRTLRYIEGRSGPYDAIERAIIDDPYALGWEAQRKGWTLAEAQERNSLSRHCRIAKREERARLIEKGYEDAKV